MRIKLNKVMILLIVLVLTMGAVSAAHNVDNNATVDDFSIFETDGAVSHNPEKLSASVESDNSAVDNHTNVLSASVVEKDYINGSSEKSKVNLLGSTDVYDEEWFEWYTITVGENEKNLKEAFEEVYDNTDEYEGFYGTILIEPGTYTTGDYVGLETPDTSGILIKADNGPVIFSGENIEYLFDVCTNFIIFKDITFENITVSSSAFKIKIRNDEGWEPQVIFENCTFRNIISADSTFNIVDAYDAHIFTDCNFINIKGGKGAVIQSEIVDLNIDNCDFINVSSSSDGGAIYINANSYSNPANIINCNFINVSADSNGGAIYIKGNSNSNPVDIEDCIFINNTAVNGGAIYNNFKYSKIINNEFYNNTAVNGGAIFVNQQSTITDNTFDDNRATDYGGSVYNTASTITFSNNVIGDSTATTGKEIYNLGKLKNVYVTLTDEPDTAVSVMVTDNNGNIIAGQEVNLFDENNDPVGSVTAADESATISLTLKPGESTITAKYVGGSNTQSNSIAKYVNNVYQGPFYVSPDGNDENDGSRDSRFKSIKKALETASREGFEPVIFIYEGTYYENSLEISDKGVNITGIGTVVINGNQSRILTVNGNYSNISNICFVNGSNEYSAPVRLIGTNGVTFENCSFINNTGKYGALYFDKADYSYIDIDGIRKTKSIPSINTTIVNCDFINNTGVECGALHINGRDNRVVDCDFINNTGKNGGAIYISSNMNIVSDSRFNNNKADNGGSIYNAATNTTLAHNTISNSAASDKGGSIYNAGMNLTLTQNTISNSIAGEGQKIYNPGTISNYKITVLENSTYDCPAINTKDENDHSLLVSKSMKVNVTVVDDMGNEISGNYINLYNNGQKILSDIYVSEGRATVTISPHNGNNIISADCPGSGDVYTSTITGHANPYTGIIYVAPWGNDDNPGTFYRCVKSMEAAIQLALASTNQAHEIWLRGGEHDFSNVKITAPITIYGLENDVEHGDVIVNGNGNEIFDIIADDVNIINIKFVNSSRAMVISGDNAHIKGSKFDDAQIIANKGADNTTIEDSIFSNSGQSTFNGDYLTIKNSNFTNMSSNEKGGALNIKSSNAVIDNCIFENCSSSNSGGAIEGSGDNAIIANTKFIDSKGSMGGAIDWSGNDDLIENCTFINTTSTNSGGAISHKNSNVIINNCNFTNITSRKDGAVYVTGRNPTISNSTFNNLHTNGNIGAISLSEGANSGVIANCTFNNVSADGYAGAIMVSRDNVVIDNCSFTNISANNKAGAIYLTSKNNSTIKDCSFTNISANGTGGAIYIHNNRQNSVTANTDIINCNFTNTHANEDGGAIYISIGDYSTLANTTVNNCNFADTHADGDGGAIYISPIFLNTNVTIVNTTINNCSFINSSTSANYANFGNKGDGGAIYIGSNGKNSTAYNATISNCNFTDIDANGYGGGIKISKVNNSNINNCNFTNMNAYSGAAIALMGNNAVVENIISNNSTSKEWGAIVVEGDYYGEEIDENNTVLRNPYSHNVTLNHIHVSNSTCNELGGGIYFNGHNGTINNTVVTDSKSYSGGGIYLNGNNATIENTAVSYNKATLGAGVFISGNYTDLINSNITYNNASQAFGGVAYSNDLRIVNTNISNNLPTDLTEKSFTETFNSSDSGLNIKVMHSLEYESYYIPFADGSIGFCISPDRMRVDPNDDLIVFVPETVQKEETQPLRKLRSAKSAEDPYASLNITNTQYKSDVSNYIKYLFYEYSHLQDGELAVVYNIFLGQKYNGTFTGTNRVKEIVKDIINKTDIQGIRIKNTGETRIIEFNGAKVMREYNFTKLINVQSWKQNVLNVMVKDTPLYDIDVNKDWDDSDNRDGVRPSEVTVNLFADGVYTNSVTLNEANGWKATFTDLPYQRNDGELLTVYPSATKTELQRPRYTNGTVIKYTIEESVANYTPNITNDYRYNFTITEHDSKVQSTITLYTNGVASQTKTLQSSNNYKVKFTNLPVYWSNGTPIKYTFKESAYSNFVVGISYSDYNIANKHVPERTNVTVTKVWLDDDDRDGFRNASITVYLDKNGQEFKSIVLPVGDDWNYTFEDLYVYEDGEKIKYSVRENVDNGNYSTVVTNDTPYNFTVTNSHTPLRTNVTVTKVWLDDDDRDGFRNASITVYLDKNGQEFKSIVLPVGDDWNYTFEDLYVYEGGEKIKYSVREDVDNGNYSTVVTNDTPYNFTVTNSHTPLRTSVNVTKVWLDDDDRDGFRSGVITVELYANGVKNTTVELSKDNDWKYSFENLHVYLNGEKINYTVKEVGVNKDYYDVVVTNNTAYNFTVTNSHTPLRTSVNVTKVWLDDDDRDGFRSGVITVELYANGVKNTTVELSKDNDWKYSFENLHVYLNGEKINYTVKEVGVNKDYYDVVVTNNTAYNFTVTNSHTPLRTSVNVTKVWLDDDNRDGFRSAVIAVALYANGKLNNTFVLSEDNEWKHTFEDLHVYANGEKINYTVKEIGVNRDKYSVTVNEVSDYNFTITNTHAPERTSINVTKIWKDDDDRDGLRTEITVELYANGVFNTSFVLSEANEWKHTFENLHVYANGEKIIYTVNERGVNKDYYAVDIVNNTAYDFTITNTHAPIRTQINVTKKWDDSDNQDGVRPANIAVILLDGEEIVAKTTLDANNGWKATFADLPVYKNKGSLINYTIREIEVDNYTVDIAKDGNYSFIINNTHVPQVTSVNVTKNWLDNDNQDGVRPNNIIVVLLDGDIQVANATLDAANDWKYTFNDLPVYKNNGTLITYTIKELEVANYTLDINNENDYSFIINNTHVPQVTEVNVTKNWIDNDNQDGIRPQNITVILLDGNTPVANATLSEQNNWTIGFTDLPVYKNNGELIIYTVEEIEVTDYTVDMTKMDDYSFIINNTHVPEVTSVSVTKIWNDSENQDGVRPVSVTVVLLDGDKIVATATLNAENNWKATFTDLPVYKNNGILIEYAIDELEVTGYSVNITGVSDYNFIIENTHVPEVTSVSVTKVWNDGDNQDGVRPVDITVILMDGDVGVAQAVLNAENNWKATFADLPVYKNNGTLITYTIDEIDVANYTVDITDGGDYNFIITNTHVPEVTQINVTKKWDDSDNQDGVRPVSITVVLSDGNAIIANATLSSSNDWMASFTDLPVYANGELIEYVVSEVAVEDYTAEITSDSEGSYIIVNTHEPFTTKIDVIKIWDDNGNSDGVRPASITVSLLANNEIIANAVLSADNGWKASFNDLPVYSNGVAIEYEIKEIKVANYNVSMVKNADGSYIITNTHNPQITYINITPIWSDGNDQDGVRPHNITVEIIANNETVAIITIYDNNWTLPGLPAYFNGTPIKYEFKVHIDNYTVNVTTDENGTVIINNTHVPVLTQISVTKLWDDDNNRAGIRPESIEVVLFGDGYYVDNAILSAANNWKTIFKDLPQFKDGKAIEYVIKEVTVPPYASKIAGNNGSYVITNTYHVKNNSGMRVEKITLTPEVPVGAITSFLIRVTNTGDVDLTGVYVREVKHDYLVYDHFTDKSGKWKFDGKDKWIYMGILAPGESAEFIVFFKTLKLGNFTNIIAAGSNQTNETTTHNVTKTFENKTHENKSNTTPHVKISVKSDKDTGNPLLALIMSLITLAVPIGYRKIK